ncbi:MAG: hypothetical protein PHT51_02555 [Patescibacteria group bacterium]|nr:hypothetical protein [Patescibacteria group bacterium]
MNQTYLKEMKKLKIQLRIAVIIFLAVASVGAVVIYSLYTHNAVLALSSNYSKSNGQQLTADEWNNLVADFASKDDLTNLSNNFVLKSSTLQVINLPFNNSNQVASVNSQIKNYKYCALSMVDDDSSAGLCRVSYNDGQWSASIGVNDSGQQNCYVSCFTW